MKDARRLAPQTIAVPMLPFSPHRWGRHADRIISGHPLDYPMGEGSPLARIYELDGWVLLLGVGYGNNTSFHLAENRVSVGVEIENGAPIIEDGRRVWKTYRDVPTAGGRVTPVV